LAVQPAVRPLAVVAAPVLVLQNTCARDPGRRSPSRSEPQSPARRAMARVPASTNRAVFALRFVRSLQTPFSARRAPLSTRNPWPRLQSQAPEAHMMPAAQLPAIFLASPQRRNPAGIGISICWPESGPYNAPPGPRASSLGALSSRGGALRFRGQASRPSQADAQHSRGTLSIAARRSA
jgi:hypothetical protein